MARRTRINWKVFEADTFLEESARKFARRELDYRQWLLIVTVQSMEPEYCTAAVEITRLKIAVPLATAQKNAQLWATRRFGSL